MVRVLKNIDVSDACIDVYIHNPLKYLNQSLLSLSISNNFFLHRFLSNLTSQSIILIVIDYYRLSPMSIAVVRFFRVCSAGYSNVS